LAKQAARCIAEQAVMDLDPEHGFILESDAALSSLDTLVRAAQVNDVVVNGRHIDVCIVEGDEVRLPVVLLHTPYIECGSLVVKMSDSASGTIAGYIDAKTWSSAESSGQFELRAKFVSPADFDLTTCLQNIEKQFAANVNKPAEATAKGEAVLQFVREAQKMDIDAQRNVLRSAIASQQVRDTMVALDNYTPDQAPTVLRDSSTWEARVQRVSKRIQSKFPKLSLSEIEKQIREVGQQYGGQPESPAFRRMLSKRLAKAQFTHHSSSAIKEVLSPFIDSVAAGKSAADAIKGFVKDAVAIDVARVINEKRAVLGHFATATAEEIGFAFQHLSLQPAYSTHSQGESGVDAINEALELYEAAAVLETLLAIDYD
jgi:hypothetical protein